MRTSALPARRLLVWLGIAVPCVVLAAAGIGRVQAQPQAKPDTELAVKRFKNIRVLKTVTADKLIPIMRSWNQSLGVKCEFCHVEGPNHTGFERDDKPTKNMARMMVTMTQDINKKERALDNRATCFMCHHGKPEPELHPAPEGDAPGGGR